MNTNYRIVHARGGGYNVAYTDVYRNHCKVRTHGRFGSSYDAVYLTVWGARLAARRHAKSAARAERNFQRAGTVVRSLGDRP